MVMFQVFNGYREAAAAGRTGLTGSVSALFVCLDNNNNEVYVLSVGQKNGHLITSIHCGSTYYTALTILRSTFNTYQESLVGVS